MPIDSLIKALLAQKHATFIKQLRLTNTKSKLDLKRKSGPIYKKKEKN